MNFFVNSNQIFNNEIFIENSDVNHIKNVLRKNVGDIIKIACGGILYKTEIIEITPELIKCKIIEKLEDKSINSLRITIFQGMPKSDKLEYIIQKCTELGVYEIVPTMMKRCVVKFDEKDKSKKIERWKKIAEVASKQSQRNDILKVEKIETFEEMCSRLKDFEYVIFAYEKEEKVKLKEILQKIDKNISNIAVIIGPEGGIDDTEAETLNKLGVKSVSLGKRILRTETAPIALSSIIMYEFEG